MEQFKRAKVIWSKQHLYITSDDKIKEDNWCIDSNGNIFQYKNHFPINIGQRKIIATTDTSLNIYTWKQSNKKSKPYNVQQNIETTKKVFIPLPQPSQQFIEKYIEQYNKGNVITDVLVEYEYLLNDNTVISYWNLKVNPKNNTITIRKLKEVYSKEELCQILEKYTSFIWKEVGIHYPISLGKDVKDIFINREL